MLALMFGAAGVMQHSLYAQGSGFVPVENITGVPTTATAGKPLALTGTALPANATNRNIQR